MQLEWRSSNQTRANATRTWLEGQLSGRQFTTPVAPVTILDPKRAGVWTTRAEILFTTPQEASTVKTLVEARQTSDSTIDPGSWWQHHDCPHDEASNACAATLTRTTK